MKSHRFIVDDIHQSQKSSRYIYNVVSNNYELSTKVLRFVETKMCILKSFSPLVHVLS